MININWQPGMTLEVIEKHAILQAYRFYRSNKTTTASALGISIRTLDNKLAQYEKEGKDQERANDAIRKQREDFQRRERGLPIESDAKLETGTGGQAQPGPILSEAETGVRVQPFVDTSQKHAMPVLEREEVQVMSFKHANGGNPKKNGR
jgi:hypothetical protein